MEEDGVGDGVERELVVMEGDYNPFNLCFLFCCNSS